MINLDIQEQFNLVAEDYDKNRKIFIPCFDDFYVNSTKIIAENISVPKKMMDLGAGTGLLSYFWIKNFPDAKYFLVDVAEEMLKIAHKRFSANKNIFYYVTDYKNNFPEENFDAIISALSIHHLTDSEKQNLFQKIYEKLPENGIFVNYDQFLAENLKINDWYNFFWENHLKNNLIKNVQYSKK